MKIAFLIRGAELKNSYSETELPDGVIKSIGTYKAEGGDLYFVTFSIGGNTVANARVLANLRDSLPTSDDVRTLQDEASAKFCELLYPHFCKFEKGLREAITVATCAEQGNFDDKHVVELEELLTLEALYGVLFVDGRFVKDTRSLTKGNFTREELLASLESLNERLLWDVLFGENDMPTFRSNRIEIKNRRNDVMHYHKMCEATFDETRALLKEVNFEIEAYLNRVRDDVAYPKTKAESAREAAQMISESYADMLEGIRSVMDLSGLSDFADQFSSISRIMTDTIDTSSFASVAQAAASMGSASSLAGTLQAAAGLNGGANLTLAALEMMDQRTIELTAGVSKVLESMQVSMPKVDIRAISGMQSAMESVKSLQALMNAQWSDAFKGISEYYQSIVPHETFENLRLAASTSMDFTAGLGIGSALNRALEAGDHNDIDPTGEDDNCSECDDGSGIDDDARSRDDI